MRTEPFRREFRRIRETFQHAFGDHERPEGATQASRFFRGGRGFPARRTASDVMQKRPITVRPESPLDIALALMLENRISGVPVVDAEGLIVGALNESDLLKIFYEPGATDVASVMTRDPVAIPVDASLTDVVDQLMASDFRRVLVHADGRLVGIITRSHLIPTILEALEERARIRREAWLQPVGSTTHH